MTDKPILFSAPMIRALLAGTKTQTRRLFKLPRWLAAHGADLSRAFPDKAFGVTPCLKVPHDFRPDDASEYLVERVRNPWGFPEPGGVRLVVRESFRLGRGYDGASPSSAPPFAKVHHEADGPAPDWAGKLRPGIHMPRWVSRFSLDVVDVRAERLRAITEDDARAEGFVGSVSPVEMFSATWTMIHGAGAWEANPFVWVVSFRRNELKA